MIFSLVGCDKRPKAAPAHRFLQVFRGWCAGVAPLLVTPYKKSQPRRVGCVLAPKTLIRVETRINSSDYTRTSDRNQSRGVAVGQAWERIEQFATNGFSSIWRMMLSFEADARRLFNVPPCRSRCRSAVSAPNSSLVLRRLAMTAGPFRRDAQNDNTYRKCSVIPRIGVMQMNELHPLYTAPPCILHFRKS